MSDSPRVLVVGAGSMGSRHVRCLAAAGAEVLLTDPDEGRARAVAAEVGPAVRTVVHADGVPPGAGALDGAVVASPTAHHRDQALALLDEVPRILVEKPLALDAATAGALAEHRDRVAVAYNLRWHAPVARTVELVRDGAAGRPSALRLWFGSWLPDWRPQVDHRTTYSARSDLGGGVLLDAIHELDLLVWLCGPGPHQVVGSVVDRLGPLEIDVEDTVMALVRTDAGIAAEITLDLLARRYRRGMEITGDDATVRLDWARQVIEVEDATGVRSEEAATPVAESYRRQAEAFVAWLGGGPPLPVDAAAGIASLRLADAIRAAAR